MSLMFVGKAQYRYSIKTVQDDAEEWEQLVTIQSNQAPSGRAIQARIPVGFFVSARTIADLVLEAQRKGWRATDKGSVFTLEWKRVTNVGRAR